MFTSLCLLPRHHAGWHRAGRPMTASVRTFVVGQVSRKTVFRAKAKITRTVQTLTERHQFALGKKAGAEVMKLISTHIARPSRDISSSKEGGSHFVEHVGSGQLPHNAPHRAELSTLQRNCLGADVLFMLGEAVGSVIVRCRLCLGEERCSLLLDVASLC